MAKKKKEPQDVLHDIYVELYAKSVPSADFDELVKNARIDEEGNKHIDYMAYVLDVETYKEIVDRHIKESKLSAIYKRALNIEAYLGCGPRTMNKEEFEKWKTEHQA